MANDQFRSKSRRGVPQQARYAEDLGTAFHRVAALLADDPAYEAIFLVLEAALEKAHATAAVQDRARSLVEKTTDRYTPGEDERSGRAGRRRAANRGRKSA